MRSSVLLLTALAFTVARAADTGDAPKRNLMGSPKKDQTKPEAQGLPASAPAREAYYDSGSSNGNGGYYDSGSSGSAIFSPTATPTKMPIGKIVGPVIGGVVGAAALGGVIAISVMKKPKPAVGGAENVGSAQPAPSAAAAAAATPAADSAAPAAPPAAPKASTTLTKEVMVGDTSIEVASTAGFVKGDTIKVGSEYQLVKSCCTIVLDHPMNTAQAAGAEVTVINDVAPVTAAPVVATAPPAIQARSGLVVAAVGGPTTAAPYTSSSGSAPLSGSTQGTVLAVSIGLVGCCCLFACVIGLYFMFGRGKKKRKAQPRQETPFVGDYPEDQQPLNQASMMSTMVDMQQSAPDLCESQYMQVQVPPLQAMQSQAYTANIGSVPTMQNVVPMQTMPPPPPMAMSQGGSLFSQGGQGSYFAQGQGSYLAGGIPQGSMYQNASPLANTVSAVPAQYPGAFQSYQNVPPTIY